MATLTVTTREKSSSLAVERKRKQGILPIALIRKSNETELVEAPNESLKEAMIGQTGLAMFDLTKGDEKLKVVVKDVQRDPSTRRVVHVSLQEILLTDVIKVPVPVKIIGEPPSVAKRAATLMTPMNTVEVQAQVSNLPEAITVDVSRLRQNDKVLVSDLDLGEGVSFLCSPGTVLAATKQLRGMADFDDDAAFAALDAAATQTETE
ncbi:MAG: 50S ribosomal protein L25 [Fimbriimonadaceae bacterium]|jgi:large subunit ribosomal protein L25|nr:50S ribosomal protein L25 [Fimbriimonadaceae bacterium]